jgi:hypothetical protein
MTSGGNIVTTVASGSVVTLTTVVTAGNTAVTPGQVNFCDATAKYCTDIHLFGTAQLTDNGTAALKFIPGAGSHSYKAVFVGTANNATSASTALTLVVTPVRPGSGSLATTTTIAASGSPNDYSLTATVSGNGSVSPTGMVSFLNTSNANVVLGTAVLTPVTTGLNFSNNSSSLNTVAVSNQQAISVVTADFNGDGIPDLALPNGPFGLTILLGNGDGTFTAAASPGTNYPQTSIAVGDFNGDGIPDLAYGTSTDDTPGGVLLGNGDGTFRPGQRLQTGNNSDSAAVGDFNGDGNLDLAITSFCPFVPNSVYIFLGNGDGTFKLGATPVTGTNPGSVAAGDFNGDGNVDLAVANNGDNSVTILLGNGDGTFTAAASPATGSGPTSVAVGDFNGDGKLDLAVTNSGSNTVTILLGNGDGTFAVAASPATGINPTSVTVGNFNGDGIADLAVANNASNTVTILVGNGDGTSTAAASPVSDSGPTSIIAGDFNGDGKTDLAVANATSNTATVLLSVAQSASATVSNIVPMGILLEASYPGDANYSGSVSGIIATPNFTLSGQQFITTTLGASTTSTITITPSNGFTGSVALTCAVTSSPSVSPPTCSVATPAAVTGTAAGTAVLTVSTQSTTSTGEYTVTVTAISGSITQTLNVSAFIPTPSYALAGQAVTIPGGASGTSVITITPSSGFTGSVALACAVNVDPEVGEAVDPPTCTVTGPVTISGTTPVTTTLNINVPASSTPEIYPVTVTTPFSGEFITVPVTVTRSAVSPDFTVTGTPVNIAPGTSGTSTITVTPIKGLLGDVTLRCEVTNGPSVVVDAPTCTIPTSVSISGTAPVTATLTVNTQTASTTGSYVVLVTGTLEVQTSEVTLVPVTIAVPTPPTPTFTLSNTAVSIPSPGASGTSTITITPSGGLTGSVALACAVIGGPAGAVDLPTCMTATPAAISGTAAVSATVTINTTATSASALQNALQRIFVFGGVAMAATLFFGLPVYGRRGKTLLCLLLFAAFTGAATGCGSAKNNTPTAPANPGTTPGSYAVTVTGSNGTTIATTQVSVVVN